MAPAITVVVCDDHETFRRGTCAMLDNTDAVEVLAEAADGNEVVALCTEERPDVVLLDLSMPELGGLEALPLLVSLDDAPAVVVVTASHAATDVLAAIDAGAIGYVVKDDAAETMISAVREAARGQSVLSPVAATALVVAHTGRVIDTRRGLSIRELEVLTLLGEGCSNREVAERLIISENTVKNHVRAILEKLGVRSRVEAVLVGIRTQLINPEPALVTDETRVSA